MSGLKRKRTPSVAPSLATSSHGNSDLPSESINPLSHPPLLLKQFAVAGYPETQHRPSELYAGFPHRPPPQDWASLHGDDASELDEEPAEPAQSPMEAWQRSRVAADRRDRRYEQHLSGFMGIIRRGLAEGDIPRAKRAFGLLMRREIKGKVVDLRHNGLWAIGAEILMREGEAPEDSAMATEGGRRRVPTPANMENARDYYTALIRQYPYNRLHRDSPSALQFYPAMFAAEIDFVYSSQKKGLGMIGEATWAASEADMDIDTPGWDYSFHDVDRPHPSYEDPYQPHYGYAGYEDSAGDLKADPGADQVAGARTKTDRLRLQALQRMRRITDRMESAMEQAPFSIDPELLRLRAMAALYMGDLSMPPVPRSLIDEALGRQQRRKFRIQARSLFEAVEEHGQRIEEEWIRDFVDQESESEAVEDEEEEQQQEAAGARNGYDPYSL